MASSTTPSPYKTNSISFLSGGMFGLTSVLVGQPFDTIKTRLQTKSTDSTITAARDLFQREGLRGLFRGGVPMWLGGALFRSAQFGCYETALGWLGGRSEAKALIFGILDPNVVLAGFAGGLGRGVVESPFEYVKVRRQVEGTWRFRDLYRGAEVTLVRNSFLFMVFMINIDFTKRYLGGLSPFWTGAICATGAWLVIWPLDVLKSQKQSGLYEGVPTSKLFWELVRTRTLYRGVVPGLTRSVFANGASMFVYEKTRTFLTDNL